MAADVLWVKVVLLSACLQSKWRPNQTCFYGDIESQTRVPPVSTPFCDLPCVLRVKEPPSQGKSEYPWVIQFDSE